MTDEERAKLLVKQFAPLGAVGREILVEAALIISSEYSDRVCRPLAGDERLCLDVDCKDVQGAARELAEMALSAPAKFRFAEAIIETVRIIADDIE